MDQRSQEEKEFDDLLGEWMDDPTEEEDDLKFREWLAIYHPDKVAFAGRMFDEAAARRAARAERPD